jgi:diphthine synthase
LNKKFSYEKDESGKLVFLSLGLRDEKDMSLRALSIARSCDVLYAEFYTNELNTNIEKLSGLIGKRIVEVARETLEEKSDILLEEAKTQKVGIFVGGDCLVATTHLALLLEARKRGIEICIIHGSSIFSAIAETGLSIYRFGKTVTIPIPTRIYRPESPYFAIKDNLEHNLHSLVLLDIEKKEKCYLEIGEGLSILLNLEEINMGKILDVETLVIGLARIGSPDQIIKADYIKNLLNYDFGNPPYALIIPGRLDFLESEALVVLAKAPYEILDEAK